MEFFGFPLNLICVVGEAGRKNGCSQLAVGFASEGVSARRPPLAPSLRNQIFVADGFVVAVVESWAVVGAVKYLERVAIDEIGRCRSQA